MSTDDSKPAPATLTPAEVAHARVAQWCAFAGITPERLAAIAAEVQALPGVAAHTQMQCGWTLVSQATGSDHYFTREGVRGPAQRLVLSLGLCSGGLSYTAQTGYHRREIVGRSASSRGGLPLLGACLREYATALDAAATDAAAVRLRAPDYKARRDREVADARAAAEGVRAIAARLRAELDGVQS